MVRWGFRLLLGSFLRKLGLPLPTLALEGERWPLLWAPLALGAPLTRMQALRMMRAGLLLSLKQWRQNMRHWPQNIPAWQRRQNRRIRRDAQALAPVVNPRKFIITLTDDARSRRSSEICLETARAWDEHARLEIFPAVAADRAVAFFADNGFSYIRTKPRERSLNVMGCLASHILLWRKCVALGEPIVVLEHDARFDGGLPPLRFRHIVMLGRPSWSTRLYKRFRPIALPDSCVGQSIWHPHPYLLGTHAYAITPTGARRLLESLSLPCFMPADQLIRKSVVDIVQLHPPMLHAEGEFSTSVQAPRQ